MSLNASCSRPLSVLAFLTLLASAPIASAQPTTVEPAHAEEMADARFKAGLKAYDREDYEAARLEFLQAQAIYPRASLLRNLALSELHTHRPLDALQHLRTFLADVGTTPDKRALAERSLGEAYAATGHLSITAAPGAHVKVDGKEVGVAPLKDAIDVVVGLHGVDAQMGGVALHESVQAGPGKLTEIAFVQPVVGETKIVVAPPTLAPPAGAYVTGHRDHEPYWNSRRTVGVVIAGVGVVGMVIGGAFGAARGSDTTNANNARVDVGPGPSACYAPPASLAPACAAETSALNSNGNDAHLEETMLIGGGVLVAVGLITTLWPNFSPRARATVTPAAGPHTAGLQWSGSF
jgi:hypothetical protein